MASVTQYKLELDTKNNIVKTFRRILAKPEYGLPETVDLFYFITPKMELRFPINQYTDKNTNETNPWKRCYPIVGSSKFKISQEVANFYETYSTIFGSMMKESNLFNENVINAMEGGINPNSIITEETAFARKINPKNLEDYIVLRTRIGNTVQIIKHEKNGKKIASSIDEINNLVKTNHVFVVLKCNASCIYWAFRTKTKELYKTQIIWTNAIMYEVGPIKGLTEQELNDMENQFNSL